MKRILIVEDDLELAQIIHDKIKHLGLCEICMSGYQAIEQLKTTSFDLVITDYHMEDGDGASLAHYCCDHSIKVVVVSSYPEAHIKPYLPLNVPFLNKFHAIRATTLEDLVQSTKPHKLARTGE